MWVAGDGNPLRASSGAQKLVMRGSVSTSQKHTGMSGTESQIN